MLRQSFLLAPLVFAVLSGCAPAPTTLPLTPLQPLPQTVRLTEADNGTQVNLNVGDTLEISLPGNPSTGYSWQPEFDPWPFLQLLGQPRFQAEGTGLGAGGRVTLGYQAAQSGEVDLSLRYVRPLAAPNPAAQEFDVTVTVQ